MTAKKMTGLIYSSLLAAMVCAATLVIRIPSPTGGYVNAGDCVVLLGAWLLGPWYGAAAAGLGSMLADLLMGYTAYVPGTLLIKGADALVAGLLFRSMGRRAVAQIVSGLIGELIMTAGYFTYTALLLGRGPGAAASIPGNLVQGGVGLLLAMLLFHALRHTGLEQKASSIHK